MRTIDRTIRNWYRRFRRQGRSAAYALRDARTMAMWENLESIGLVRFRFVADEFCYDDSYIDTWTDMSEESRNRWRERLWEQIKRDGVWGLVGEFRTLPRGYGEESIYREPDDEPGWEQADSIWGLVGTEENGYETDIAFATMGALRRALRNRCPRCRSCQSPQAHG